MRGPCARDALRLPVSRLSFSDSPWFLRSQSHTTDNPTARWPELLVWHLLPSAPGAASPCACSCTTTGGEPCPTAAVEERRHKHCKLLASALSRITCPRHVPLAQDSKTPGLLQNQTQTSLASPQLLDAFHAHVRPAGPRLERLAPRDPVRWRRRLRSGARPGPRNRGLCRRRLFPAGPVHNSGGAEQRLPSGSRVWTYNPFLCLG